MFKALDLSNYDYDVAEGDKAKQLVALGWNHYFMGAQRLDSSLPIVRAMSAAGATCLATYAYLYFGYDVTAEVQKAIDLANAADCKYIVLDIESTTAQENGILTPSARLAAIKTAINVAEKAGKRVIIYTYGPYWVNQIGNATDLSSYPLWYANYGMNDGSLAPIETVSFGGWTKVAIHQFCSGVEILGRDRDQNYVIDETLFEDGEITMATAKQLQDQIDALKLQADGLNTAFQLRAAIHRLADGDYELVKQATITLKAAGLLP